MLFSINKIISMIKKQKREICGNENIKEELIQEEREMVFNEEEEKKQNNKNNNNNNKQNKKIKCIK